MLQITKERVEVEGAFFLDTVPCLSRPELEGLPIADHRKRLLACVNTRPYKEVARARRYFDVAVLPTSFIAGTYPPIADADETPGPPDAAILSFGAVTLAATPPALPLAACMLGRLTEPVPILLAGNEAACVCPACACPAAPVLAAAPPAGCPPLEPPWPPLAPPRPPARLPLAPPPCPPRLAFLAPRTFAAARCALRPLRFGPGRGGKPI